MRVWYHGLVVAGDESRLADSRLRRPVGLAAWRTPGSPSQLRDLRPHRGDDGPQVVGTHGRRGHQDNYVAERADDDAVGANAHADLGADAAPRVERPAGLAVLDQLDADHVAELADVADVGEVAQLVQQRGEFGGVRRDLFDDVV